MELNNNFFILTGIIGSCSIFYCIYIYCKKKNNRNIVNIEIPENPLEYSIIIDNQTSSNSSLNIPSLNIPSLNIPSLNIPSYNTIHQNPIPPPYNEIDDNLILMPPPYKE